MRPGTSDPEDAVQVRGFEREAEGEGGEVEGEESRGEWEGTEAEGAEPSEVEGADQSEVDPTPRRTNSEGAEIIEISESGEESEDAPLSVRDYINQRGPKLCPEQAELVELIASGKNVFYTGSAGCGKSTVLKAFTRLLRDMGKNVYILAPTGRAALQVNGMTTWTYAGWTPDSQKRPLKELLAAAHGKNVWKRFDRTDVLVIDEISMVENHHLERLNAVMKEARYNSNLDVQPAFGGVQVIVTGDFCQLPPVEPFRYCIECGAALKKSHHRGSTVHTCYLHGSFPDEDKWAFRSKAWKECDFAHVHLWTIHRQSDDAFIRILQKCRLGDRLLPQEVDLLLNHDCNVQNATQLFPLRKGANDVNMVAFNKLKSENHTYWCLDHFDQRNPRHPSKDRRADVGPASRRPLQALDAHRYGELVQIKRGMLVVLLINLDMECGLCNGSQGLVCGFEEHDPENMPRASKRASGLQPRLRGDYADKKEDQIRMFMQGEGVAKKVWPVVRFFNGQKRTIFADCSVTECGDDKPYSLLCRTQIPLAPAWAMTIHKSQSLTLSRVVVNLENAFQEGQVYVALSRATSLSGLKITGNADKLRGRLEGNKEVQDFLREKFGDRAAPESGKQHKIDFFLPRDVIHSF